MFFYLYLSYYKFYLHDSIFILIKTIFVHITNNMTYSFIILIIFLREFFKTVYQLY